ncbi:hypothetical protein [Streptomyces sp. NPDC058964]|uniref:hypothetical protein n=1 Tax=Streptomyces sp. NPDC058964 TaxID=3346681 RepID=UPI0036CA15B4
MKIGRLRVEVTLLGAAPGCLPPAVAMLPLAQLEPGSSYAAVPGRHEGHRGDITALAAASEANTVATGCARMPG